MSITVEATYEDGVLKPKQPLLLAEHEVVLVTIRTAPTLAERTYGMLGWKGDHETLKRLLTEVEEQIP
jgi:predicted DNA-binding antitoxin AbrB/MazE fold protein